MNSDTLEVITILNLFIIVIGLINIHFTGQQSKIIDSYQKTIDKLVGHLDDVKTPKQKRKEGINKIVNDLKSSLNGECGKATAYSFVDLENGDDKHTITCSNGSIYEFVIPKETAQIEIKKIK